MQPHGKTIAWPDYLNTYIGFDDRDAFRHAWPALSDEQLAVRIEQKAAAFQTLLQSDGARALPGAVELIRHLSGQLPIAICSGALREDIDPILKSLGVDNAFDEIVTADDTPISKPDPAPYLLTQERLGISDAIAIEDTPAGIASARGAGLQVLAVTNSYAAEALTEADRIVDSLEGLTLQQIRKG